MTPTLIVAPAPQRRGPHSSQCLFCKRHKCVDRICTPNLGYDELACAEHVRDLERHADATLGGVRRRHVSGTGKLRRGVAAEGSL